MKLKQLISAYSDNKINKRVYWDLLRDKLKSLDEINEALLDNHECNSITVSKDGTFLNFDDDIKLLFDFSQKICRSELIFGKTEREDLIFLDKVIDKLSSCTDCFSLNNRVGEEQKIGKKIIIDIGANVGRVSLHLSKHHGNYSVYALEPVKSTYNWLLRNLSLNSSFSSGIIPFNLGCYNENTELKFYVPIENEAASARPIEDDYYKKSDSKEEVTEIVCKVKKLDDFCYDNSILSVDFIKVDTEGAEKFVFEGGQKVLDQLKPVVYTEMLRKHAARFSYHPNEIIELFKKLGYSAYVIENDRIRHFDKMDDSTLETNFLFLHDKKHEPIIREFLMG